MCLRKYGALYSHLLYCARGADPGATAQSACLASLAASSPAAATATAAAIVVAATTAAATATATAAAAAAITDTSIQGRNHCHGSPF